MGMRNLDPPALLLLPNGHHAVVVQLKWLSIAAAAQNETGRRNTALGLGALTGYLFTRGGNKTPAFVAAGATAYAYKRYDDAVRARHRRERLARLRAPVV